MRKRDSMSTPEDWREAKKEGKELKERRERLGVTQPHLGRLIGRTQKSVSYYERGERRMDKKIKEKIDKELTKYEKEQSGKFYKELTNLEKLNLLLDYQGKKIKIRRYENGVRIIEYWYARKYQEMYEVEDPEKYVEERLEVETERLEYVLAVVEKGIEEMTER